MIKDKIFSSLRESLGDYLFGFDKEKVKLNLLRGNVELQNLIIKPDKLNELFDEADAPIALKAGLISKLSVKVRLLSKSKTFVSIA